MQGQLKRMAPRVVIALLPLLVVGCVTVPPNPNPQPIDPTPVPDPTPTANTTCYGARDAADCYTCDDVVNAYKARGWAYDATKFEQCNTQPQAAPANTTCYGARDATNCYTCDDVVNAYKARGWAYDQSKFAQCNNSPPPAKP